MSETENEMALVQVTAEVKGWDNQWHLITTERAAAKAASYTLGGHRHAIESDGAMLVEFTTSEINEMQHLGRFTRTASSGRFRISAEMP